MKKNTLSILIFFTKFLEDALWNIADIFMFLSEQMETVGLAMQMHKIFGKENKRCPECKDIWVWKKTERDEFDIVCRSCGKAMDEYIDCEI